MWTPAAVQHGQSGIGDFEGADDLAHRSERGARFQCSGCSHFRTEPSFVPQLDQHIARLVDDRERALASIGDTGDS